LRQLSKEYLGFGPPTLANMAELNALPFRAPAAMHENADNEQMRHHMPARGDGIDPGQPQIQTQMRKPAHVAASTPRSPSIVSVAFARLQRLLLPTAAGATASREVRP